MSVIMIAHTLTCKHPKGYIKGIQRQFVPQQDVLDREDFFRGSEMAVADAAESEKDRE